ncbi:hypothetical protein JTB14_030328 [Gonioctena quinquepunctata]|nr:hypothetical protein JTB14_030328 [Gonioctena quinquepunctata]
MFIVGLSNQSIKEKLLQEESLNLDRAIKIAKAIEITQLQARNLNKSTEVVVAKVGRSAHNSANWQKSKNSHLSNQVEGTSNSRQVSHTRSVCTRCGEIHKFKCPAQNVTCSICRKIGHFAK